MLRYKNLSPLLAGALLALVSAAAVVGSPSSGSCKKQFKDIMKLAVNYPDQQSFQQALNFYNATMGLTMVSPPTNIPKTQPDGTTITYVEASVRIPGSNATAFEFLVYPDNTTSWVEFESFCFTGAVEYFSDNNITVEVFNFAIPYFTLITARVLQPTLSQNRALQTNWYYPYYMQDRYMYGYNETTDMPYPLPDGPNNFGVEEILSFRMSSSASNWSSDRSSLTQVLCKPNKNVSPTGPATWFFKSGPKFVHEGKSNTAHSNEFIVEAKVVDPAATLKALQSMGVNVATLADGVELYGITWMFV